ncbi:MAG: hypothetical protein RIS76_1611 [Verrucomicrobiota bacterium]
MFGVFGVVTQRAVWKAPQVANVFWLFGRSGAGKTTLANRLCQELRERSRPVVFIDGDLARSGLSSDLGFTPGSRTENHRRVAEVARLVCEQGITAVVATMAPEYEQRDLVQRVLGDRIVWVYVEAPLEECLRRDPKGLYRKAKDGKLNHLLDYPFETPRPQEREIVVNTTSAPVDDCHHQLLGDVLRRMGDVGV